MAGSRLLYAGLLFSDMRREAETPMHTNLHRGFCVHREASDKHTACKENRKKRVY